MKAKIKKMYEKILNRFPNSKVLFAVTSCIIVAVIILVVIFAFTIK